MLSEDTDIQPSAVSERVWALLPYILSLLEVLGFVYGSEGVTFDCKQGLFSYCWVFSSHPAPCFHTESVFIRHACDSIASEIQSSYSAVGQTLLEQRVGFLNVFLVSETS